jgi:hypothetical protein
MLDYFPVYGPDAPTNDRSMVRIGRIDALSCSIAYGLAGPPVGPIGHQRLRPHPGCVHNLRAQV